MLSNLENLKYGHTILKNQIPNDFSEIKQRIANYFARPLTDKQPFALEITQAESGYRDLQHKELFMVKSKQVPVELLPSLELAEQLHDLGLRCLKMIADQFCWDWTYIKTLVEPVAVPEHGQNDSVFRLVNYHPVDNSELGIDTDIHEDLGLFTFVLPTGVPALEVYDFVDGQEWIDIEALQGATDVIVMAGESLALISNDEYIPATHRVRCVSTPRLAINYHMRLKRDAIIDSSRLTTPNTGEFSKPFRITGAEFLATEMQRRVSINGSY